MWQDLETLDKESTQEALAKFKSIATVGSIVDIQKHQVAMVADIRAQFQDYEQVGGVAAVPCSVWRGRCAWSLRVRRQI